MEQFSHLKVSDGYSCLEEEMEARLRKQFIAHKADFFFINFSSPEFLQATVAYGLKKGWLADGEAHLEGIRYRLSPEGKKYFGVL